MDLILYACCPVWPNVFVINIVFEILLLSGAKFISRTKAVPAIGTVGVSGLLLGWCFLHFFFDTAIGDSFRGSIRTLWSAWRICRGTEGSCLVFANFPIVVQLPVIALPSISG